MRQASTVLMVLLLVSACGGSEASDSTSTLRSATTVGLGANEASTESTSTLVTTTMGLGADQASTESTSTLVTTTMGFGTDQATPESTLAAQEEDDGRSEPNNVATPGFDIHSGFACIITALGETAAFELNTRPPTSHELTQIEHCPPSTHDVSCVDNALGMEITDLLLAGRYEPSPEEVERVAQCVLSGSSDSEVEAVDETASGGEAMPDVSLFDIQSSYTCVRDLLGENAAAGLGTRTLQSSELALVDSCQLPTHDPTCVWEFVGQGMFDKLRNGLHRPTARDLESIAHCLMAEGSTWSSWVGSGAPGTDPTPGEHLAGLVRGDLVAAEVPMASHQPAEEGHCSAYEGDMCSELRWEPVADLLAGEFTSIQISPTNPNVIYAGIDSNDMSLYKSVDAGATWKLVHASGHTSGLAVHPTDPETVLYTILEGPVQRTNDGGASWIQVVGKNAGSYGLWNRVNPAPDAKLFTAVAFSPEEPNVVYTVSHEGDYRTGTDRGPVSVYVSDDSGLGWRYAGTCDTCGAIHEFAIRPGDSSEVWVAANNGVQVSRDGGESWSGNLLPIAEHKHQATYGVVVNPGDPQIILVASQEAGMFRSQDGGLTWAATNSGLTTERLHKVVFAPSQPNVAYVATHEGVFRSDDAGMTWQPRSEGLPYTFLTPIAVDPTDPDTIYVGTASELVTTHTDHFNDGIHEGEGLYKSTDGGLTWFRSDKGIYEAKAAQLGTHPLLPFNLWVDGESGRGAFFTPDAGDTWLFAPFRASHYPMVFAFTRTFPTVMYVTSWMDDGELMQSVDSGAVWTDITEAVNIGVSDTTRSMGLLDETHRRWFHLHGLAVAPSDPNVIYVGSVHDSVYNLQFTLNGAHIFRSSDAGRTFTEVSEGFPIGTETAINVIVVDPTDPDTAYAMTSLHETSTAIGIYKTTNAGENWAPVNNGLDVLTNDLQLDPVDPETLYAATESGVYKTTDGAKSWRALSVDESGTPIIDLAIDPVNSLVLYAISPHNLYRTKDGGETWYPTNFGLPLLNDGQAFSNYSTSNHRGHRIYGGTFAQDRTLEIDATGRAIYVVVKTETTDGRGSKDNFPAIRHLYRALLEPLRPVAYSFEVGTAVVRAESTSNIYDVIFDQKNREIRLTAAGPTGTTGGSTVTIPGSLLEGPFAVTVDGQSVGSNMQGNSVSFVYDHTGRSQVTIRGE